MSSIKSEHKAMNLPLLALQTYTIRWDLNKNPAAALTLVFHHHDFEFAPVNGGQWKQFSTNQNHPLTPITPSGTTKFDLLFNLTTVGFILDTYWTTKSGHNPVDLVKRLGNRLAGLHIRDFQREPSGKSTDCALGRGSVDFSEVLKAAGSLSEPSASLINRYAAIEQGTHTPWESLQMSMDHLHSTEINKLIAWKIE